MRIALSLLVLVGIAGCPGKAPPDQAADVDAGVDAAVTPTGLMLSGTVMDYFGNVAAADAILTIDGLEPAAVATSGTDGAYQVEVAVGSKLFVVATKPPGYRPTRNQALTVADMPITQDVYVMATQDVQNQYTGVGATPVAGTAFVAAELRRNNNTPLEGIPLTSIQLLDTANQPVAGVKGPYVFNAAGAIDQTLTTVTAFGGRARIAYLDVPPGTHTLAVTYQNDQGGDVTINTTLTAAADGATLVLSGGMGGGGGGSNITDPLFATDIYPKLQRAAAGGLGCANCHTLTGPAAVLKYDDPAADVLAAMLARPGVINTATPADSLLLKRPLYEQAPTPQDHPNATFIDVNDADYKLFLLWITNGAKP